MILRLLHAGSRRAGPLDDAAHDYQSRLSRYLRVDERWVKPARLPDESAAHVERALAEEGQRLLEAVGERELLVALCVRGEAWSSEDLARRLEGWKRSGATAVAFALGSAHGLHARVVERAEARWSFGPLTLPHDLARVVLWEQLYRAESITRGLPYHK